MDLLNMRILQGGFFKQVRFLLGSSQKVQRCLVISESGIVTLEYIPIRTGFVSADAVKKAWTVLHTLKFRLHKYGQEVQDDSVLALSERSYVPLDPFNTIKEKDKQRLSSLKDIAKLRHAEARADMSKLEDVRTRLQHLIINGCFVIWVFFALIALLKGCS